MKHNVLKVLVALISLCLISFVYASAEGEGAIIRHPSPAPKGTEFVFESEDLDGKPHLWISEIDGRKIRKIDTGSSHSKAPAWSPDGSFIAFTSSIRKNGKNIWAVRPDGSHLTQLTHLPMGGRQPGWSPDGKKIAFVGYGIWIMQADGSAPMLVTNLPGEHPSFSPKGDEIVFSLTQDNHSKLMIIGVDGSNLRSLTTENFHDWNPNWGKKGILFASDRDASGHWKIWLIQPDGIGLQKVYDVTALDPVWMGDNKILFSDEMTNTPGFESVISLLDFSSGKKTVVSPHKNVAKDK